MPAVLEPPGAPPAAPDAAVAAAAARQPPIVVSQIPGPAEAPPPPKPGSAKERMFESLRSKATLPGSTASPPAQPGAVPPAGGEAPPASPPAAVPPAGEKPAGETPPAAPAITPEEKKKNPWRLVDDYKQRLTKTETELAEIRKHVLPEAEREAQRKEQEAAKARLEELENEIRYVNYEKSKEFKEKYDAPYESAWKRAMSELSEISVIADEATGQRRPTTPGDLLALMNMPLEQAQTTAEQMFGNLASYVMGHRKELRTIFDARQEALNKAKTEGAEREKLQAKERTESFEKLRGFIKTEWDKAHTEAIADEHYGHYFKPVEGDQDGNQRLAKGYELVDRAFSENPLDPSLTPGQRAEVVRRHVAVRNRAAAAGRLIAQNRALSERVAALEKQLKEFNGSVPPTVAPAAPGTPSPGRHSAWEDVRADLAKRAVTRGA